ncbi:MAG: DUF4259 domain-containing protein [Phycisphaerales bacterium]
MGTWGAGIFDSDTALDIEAEFRDMMGEGVGVEDAVKKLIEDWDPENDIEDEGAEFWLALAAVQVKAGRLTEMVKKRALEIIESEAGVAGFERDCPELVPARKRAIKRLEKRILGRQKKPTKIKKPFVDEIEWEVGDGLAYQLPSGKWTGLKVRKIERTPKYQEALYVVLDVYQEAVPSVEDFESAQPLPTKYTKDQVENEIRETKAELYKMGGKYPEKRSSILENLIESRRQVLLRSSVISLSRSGKRDKPGGELRLVVKKLPHDDIHRALGSCFGGWKELDGYLQKYFDLK